MRPAPEAATLAQAPRPAAPVQVAVPAPAEEAVEPPPLDALAQAQSNLALSDEALQARYPLHGVVFHALGQVFEKPDVNSFVIGLMRRGTTLRASAAVTTAMEGHGCDGTWHELWTRGYVCKAAAFTRAYAADVYAIACSRGALRHAALPVREEHGQGRAAVLPRAERARADGRRSELRRDAGAAGAAARGERSSHSGGRRAGRRPNAAAATAGANGDGAGLLRQRRRRRASGRTHVRAHSARRLRRSESAHRGHAAQAGRRCARPERYFAARHRVSRGRQGARARSAHRRAHARRCTAALCARTADCEHARGSRRQRHDALGSLGRSQQAASRRAVARPASCPRTRA